MAPLESCELCVCVYLYIWPNNDYSVFLCCCLIKEYFCVPILLPLLIKILEIFVLIQPTYTVVKVQYMVKYMMHICAGAVSRQEYYINKINKYLSLKNDPMHTLNEVNAAGRVICAP